MAPKMADFTVKSAIVGPLVSCITEVGMDKSIQIHVLENIADHGGWQWTTGFHVPPDAIAGRRFTDSGFDVGEYYACTRAMIASAKVVGRTGSYPSHSPLCLTLEGYELLSDLRKCYVRRWFERNWFPAVVAASTILTAIASIAVNVWLNAGSPPPDAGG